MEWQETFGAYGFGMLKDKFGMSWMVSFNKPYLIFANDAPALTIYIASRGA